MAEVLCENAGRPHDHAKARNINSARFMPLLRRNDCEPPTRHDGVRLCVVRGTGGVTELPSLLREQPVWQSSTIISTFTPLLLSK